jgi:hypothetical protein
LAIRINNWLEREASADFEDETPIDADVGITFADFKSTLLYLRVLTAERREGLFLRTHLGTLQQVSDDA